MKHEIFLIVNIDTWRHWNNSPICGLSCGLKNNNGGGLKKIPSTTNCSKNCKANI